MPENIYGNWEGKINHSSIELAMKVIQCKREDELIPTLNRRKTIAYGIASLVIASIFIAFNGFDIRNWVDSALDLILEILLATSAFLYIIFAKRNFESSFEKYRQILVNRIHSDFCPCSEKCDHREEFMKYMDKKYGIKLYY